jgi:hypothetical protein
MVSIVGARCLAPDIGHAQRAPTLQGAQIILVGAIHELPLRVRRSDRAEAQSRSKRDRWTFYETIKIQNKVKKEQGKFE